MEVIAIDSEQPLVTDIKKVVAHLKRGGIAVYPTETSYGFGVDATNAAAVRRLFYLKGRKTSKSFPVIVGDMKQAEGVVKFSEKARMLAKKFWPGPLTLVLPCKAQTVFAKGVTHRGMLAVRVSSHPIARSLARGLGKPLVATSANRAGQPACYSIRVLKKQFSSLKDVLIIDEGRLPKRIASTVVQDGMVLRHGAIRI